MALIASGKSDKQVAEVQGVKVQTVKNRNHLLYEKLGIDCRSRLVALYVLAEIAAVQTGRDLCELIIKFSPRRGKTDAEYYC